MGAEQSIESTYLGFVGNICGPAVVYCAPANPLAAKKAVRYFSADNAKRLIDEVYATNV